MQKDAEQAGMPDMWSTYLRSDDAEATAEAVTANGGQVYMPPMDVPEQGHMAIFGDASGAAVGVWQPREMRGYELVAEPGAAAWHELHTKDYDAAVKFYQNVFGWETDVMSDTPDFRYTTLGAGRFRQGGHHGRLRLPAGRGSVQLAGLLQRGGRRRLDREGSCPRAPRCIDGPEDSPFGRLATLADPTGAIFKIIA